MAGHIVMPNTAPATPHPPSLTLNLAPRTGPAATTGDDDDDDEQQQLEQQQQQWDQQPDTPRSPEQLEQHRLDQIRRIFQTFDLVLEAAEQLGSPERWRIEAEIRRFASWEEPFGAIWNQPRRRNRLLRDDPLLYRYLGEIMNDVESGLFETYTIINDGGGGGGGGRGGEDGGEGGGNAAATDSAAILSQWLKYLSFLVGRLLNVSPRIYEATHAETPDDSDADEEVQEEGGRQSVAEGGVVVVVNGASPGGSVAVPGPFDGRRLKRYSGALPTPRGGRMPREPPDEEQQQQQHRHHHHHQEEEEEEQESEAMGVSEIKALVKARADLRPFVRAGRLPVRPVYLFVRDGWLDRGEFKALLAGGLVPASAPGRGAAMLKLALDGCRARKGQTLARRVAGLRASLADVDAILDSGVDVDAADRHGTTALLHASAVGIAGQIAHLLLRRGADVGRRDSHGRLALCHLARNDKLSPEQMHDLLPAFLSRGRSAGLAAGGLDEPDRHGRTAFSHLMAESRAIDLAGYALLMARRPDVDRRDAHGRTALSYAVENDVWANLNLLVNLASADVALPDVRGDTPYDLATKLGHTYIQRHMPGHELVRSRYFRYMVSPGRLYMVYLDFVRKAFNGLQPFTGWIADFLRYLFPLVVAGLRTVIRLLGGDQGT